MYYVSKFHHCLLVRSILTSCKWSGYFLLMHWLRLSLFSLHMRLFQVLNDKSWVNSARPCRQMNVCKSAKSAEWIKSETPLWLICDATESFDASPVFCDASGDKNWPSFKIHRRPFTLYALLCPVSPHKHTVRIYCKGAICMFLDHIKE